MGVLIINSNGQVDKLSFFIVDSSYPYVLFAEVISEGKKYHYCNGELHIVYDDTNPETSQKNKGFHRAVSNYYKLINQNPFTIKYSSSTHGDIPCPVPSSAIWTREIGDWRYIGEVGEVSYANDWCYSEERMGDSYSEYIGSSNRRKILNQTINNYSIECFAEEW